MKIELSSPNSYMREMAVRLDWSEIAGEYDKTEKKFIKTVKMPGFRPGKVPRKVILQQYQTHIDAQFVDDAIQRYYLEALKEKDLNPVNQAKVADVEFENGQPLAFKVSFEIEPVIELPELKKGSLKVERTVYISDDQDIDDTIREIRERFSEARTVEDGAKVGDFIIADLQKIDDTGLPLIGEKFEKRYIKIGDGVFGGSNQERLLGLKPGASARVEIPEAEGKAVNTYEVRVINVEERVLAEINAEFIKQVDPEAADEQDWRRRVKERIDHNLEHRSDEAFNRALSDTLIELVNPEYPPSMVEAYLDRVVEDAKANNSGGLDEQQLREIYRPMAEHNLKWYLIHAAIIRQQKFEISATELEAEIRRLVERSPASEAEIVKYYKKPSNKHKLEDDLLESKILEFLKEFAKVKETKVKTKDLREKSAKE
ncbi:MAG: trigger factor [Candidatus Neomarinimicrobiota bacterium]